MAKLMSTRRPLVIAEHTLTDNYCKTLRYRTRRPWDKLTPAQRSRVLMSMAHDLRTIADNCEMQALALEGETS